jgi:transcriptional regulator with XRE-family HTH domain
MAKRAMARLRPLPPALYKNLAAYFRESGDTQTAVADRFQITQAQVSRIVAGDVVPRPALKYRLAEYARVPLDSFDIAYLEKHGRVA